MFNTAKWKSSAAKFLAAGFIVGAMTAPTMAEDKWFPFKVMDASSGTPIEKDYVGLEKASKPYNLCVLFPHLKDSSWVAVAYGVAKQAEALNVNMSLFEAGGYDNLPKQISQFDDCVASGSDAIVVGAISGAGLSKKFEEAKAKGIPVVGVINPLEANSVPAAIFADFTALGEISGEGLLSHLKADEVANVVTFPGPAGSGWAESFNDGFKKVVVKNPNVKILDEKFGDTGVGVQLRLVQDALQAFPNMNVIYGTAPTVEAAIGVVQMAGRTDITILSCYSNQAMLDALKRGDILGFPTEFNAAQGAIAIDLAVRLLEDQPVMSVVHPRAVMVDKETVATLPINLIFAPDGWQPVYSVNAK